MRICILAPLEHVEAVRTKAREILPEISDHPLLNIPVSADGKEPATHYFCHFLVSREIADRILAAQNLADIAIASPSKFLAGKNLKIVGKG